MIYIILLLAFVFRLFAINQSLWLDEAIGALVARDFSYRGIFVEFMKFDNHPPIYYLTLKFWSSFFGFSEFGLRSLSILFGVLTIYFVYKISFIISGGKKSVSNLSALLMATSQFHIYYSQEARMYSMAAFLVTVAMYLFLKILEEKHDKKDRTIYWLFFSLAIAVLAFTDYLPIFVIPVFWIIGVIKKRDFNWWKKFILSHCLLVAAGFAWLPTFSIQLDKGRWLVGVLPSWKSIAGGANFKQLALVWMKFVFGRVTLTNKTLYYFLVFVASVPVVIAFYQLFKKRKKGFELPYLWLFIPLVLGFIVSFFFPAFIYFRFTFVVPAFYILISFGINSIDNTFIKRSLITFLLLLNLVSAGIYTSNKTQQREDWKGAVEFVESSVKKDEVILFDYSEPFAPYRWYTNGKASAHGATDSISANGGETQEITRSFVEHASGVYYFEYLWQLSDPLDIVRIEIRNQGYSLKNSYDFHGVGFVHYFTR